MEITDIQVHLINDVKLKAYVAVIFDHCFVVKDMKVIQGNNGLFVAMPNKKGKDGVHRDIAHPINSATRKLVESSVLKAYKSKLEEIEENSQENSPKESEE